MTRAAAAHQAGSVSSLRSAQFGFVVPLGVCTLLLLLIAGCGPAGEAGSATGAGSLQFTAAELPSDDELRARIDRVLVFTEARYLDADRHAAWQVVHGVMAFGRRFKMQHQDEVVSALDYLLEGGRLEGWRLMPGDQGVIAMLEPGTKTGQGHRDQWLGYLAQCDLEWDDPIVVGGTPYKIGDLVTQAQWDVEEGMECGWTLPGLAAFLPLDASWQARDGSTWDFGRLMAEELKSDVNTSACGGTHSLIGMTTVLNRYLAEGRPLEEEWAAAEARVQDAVAKAKAHQQPDGLFSTSFFERPSSSPDVALRINTTGHTLEFLALALDDEQLQEPWITKAVDQLCTLFEQTRDVSVECGSLYHASRGLMLYRWRRFGFPDGIAARVAAPPPKSPGTTK